MADYVIEALIASFLVAFGWAFREWAKNVKEGTKSILKAVEGVRTELHKHVVVAENRMTSLEERTDTQGKDIDRLMDKVL